MRKNSATVRELITHKGLTITIIVGGVIICMLAGGALYLLYHHASSLPLPFFASIDTMKMSRDTARRQLSKQEITKIVDTSASLNVNYITVDTQWDYPDYMAEWIEAIRSTKHHVWFRIAPNHWEDTNGSTGIMTPAQYMTSEREFVLAHPSFFESGDILDPCPEAEQGLYWKATYGQGWTNNAPNTATVAYNTFLRQTTDVASAALQKKGINGVITTIRSVNSFIATHPSVLELATVEKFGTITVDSYPDKDTLNPAIAAQARIAELNRIETLWHVPIIIGEMGYSNNIPVDDAAQQAVLRAEFAQLQSLPYLQGVNYWVGAGSNTDGGYTYIITKKNSAWVLRPAAYSLAAFYRFMQQRQQ